MAGVGAHEGRFLTHTLRSDAEQSMDEFTLAHRITLWQPPDLSFANRVHRLITFDRSPCCFRRAESEAGYDAFLDEPMVLLDDVI